MSGSVKVKKASGTYGRPIAKICVIYRIEGLTAMKIWIPTVKGVLRPFRDYN